VLGYVLNHLESRPSLAAETNTEALLSLTAIPCLGEIPFIEDLEAKRSSLANLVDDRLNFGLLETALRRR
jgi:hypothetical protein